MFPTTSQWDNASQINVEEVRRAALNVLRETSTPQAVHFHDSEASCVRGEGCFLLRVGEK